MNEIELYSSINEQEILQVCSILDSNKIPFIRRDSGSGSYMNLSMGYSIQEKKIFVSEMHYEKALELIQSFIPDNSIELSEDEPENFGEKKYKMIRYILVFLVIGLPLIAIIAIIISSLFY